MNLLQDVTFDLQTMSAYRTPLKEKEFLHVQKHQSNDLAPTTPMIFYFAAFAHGFTLRVENIP